MQDWNSASLSHRRAEEVLIEGFKAVEAKPPHKIEEEGGVTYWNVYEFIAVVYQHETSREIRNQWDALKRDGFSAYDPYVEKEEHVAGSSHRSKVPYLSSKDMWLLIGRLNPQLIEGCEFVSDLQQFYTDTVLEVERFQMDPEARGQVAGEVALQSPEETVNAMLKNHDFDGIRAFTSVLYRKAAMEAYDLSLIDGKARQYFIPTNVFYHAFFGGSAKQVRDSLGLSADTNLRDWLRSQPEHKAAVDAIAHAEMWIASVLPKDGSVESNKTTNEIFRRAGVMFAGIYDAYCDQYGVVPICLD